MFAALKFGSGRWLVPLGQATLYRAQKITYGTGGGFGSIALPRLEAFGQKPAPKVSESSIDFAKSGSRSTNSFIPIRLR